MSALTDTIDSTLSGYLPSITTKQESVLASSGHYFQGLPSCGVIPADGADAVIDQWDTAPIYDASLTWRAAWGGAPPAMQSQLTIDQYISPSGPGWVLTAKVVEAGVAMVRTINFGPETWRDSGGWVTERV
jgi:hypothetical protein